LKGHSTINCAREFERDVFSVIVRENRAGPKDRGRPFTFIFSQYKSSPKRSTTMIFAKVGVGFSSINPQIMILASQAVENGRNFGQLEVSRKDASHKFQKLLFSCDNIGPLIS